MGDSSTAKLFDVPSGIGKLTTEAIPDVLSRGTLLKVPESPGLFKETVRYWLGTTVLVPVKRMERSSISDHKALPIV